MYGSKGGSNYSDIDILTVDKDENFYDYKIKWCLVYFLNIKDKRGLILL